MGGLLALDLGTKTGFAISASGGGAIICGTQDFTPSRYDSQAMRFLRFNRWLDEIHSGAAIKHVAYEEVRRHAGTTAAHVYGGFWSHLMSWCEVNGVAAEAYPVNAIKKFWTGKGNASKEAMVAEARRRGFEVPDDNAADALAILHMMRGGE